MAAPMANSPAADAPKGGSAAGAPSMKKNGNSGTMAPIENSTKDEMAAIHGDPPSSLGSSPSSSRDQGVEGGSFVGHHPLGQLAGLVSGQALAR
jgi:hypothetical protein